MRRTFLILVVAAAALSCGRPAAPPPAADTRDVHPATLEAAQALAIERNVPLLIDFFSET